MGAQVKRLLAILAIACLAACTHPSPIDKSKNLQGTWMLNREASKGIETLAPGDIQLVIYQDRAKNGITFRFNSALGVGDDNFTTDGIQRRMWRSKQVAGDPHVGEVYASAEWHGSRLVINRRMVLLPEGKELWKETNEWFLSNDGKRLTDVRKRTAATGSLDQESVFDRISSEAAGAQLVPQVRVPLLDANPGSGSSIALPQPCGCCVRVERTFG